MWPFETKKVAKCNSINCSIDAMETKPMLVNKDVYNDYLTTIIFPAIHAKFPGY